MAYCVHISTCFAAPHTRLGAKIARDHMQKYDNEEEIWAMLKAFAEGKGFFNHRQGTLFNWGVIGNYTNGLEFSLQLLSFLEDLRAAENETFFFRTLHAMVFCEGEGKYATAYEIKPGEFAELATEPGIEPNLIVCAHKSTFCWNPF